MTRAITRKFINECVLSRGLDINELLRVRKQTILYVQPCASERGKLMADVELSEDLERDFFEGNVLCRVLELAALGFSSFKCSPKLGVAKFMWKGREISVFRNGKLKIQRCLDRNDVLRVANRVARLVWAAAKCGVCGRPAIECAAGRCGRCVRKQQSTDLAALPAGELLEHSMVLEDKRRAAYYVLRFIVETPTRESATVGLSLLARFLD